MSKERQQKRHEWADQVERLLETPCWVIDVLPLQVPADAAGQFAEVEQVLLQDLRRKFAHVLLKLNCYHDLLVYRGERNKPALNPKPQKLMRWVEDDADGLSILLPGEDALMVVQTQSTCMTIYNPAFDLLDLVEQLAGAEGLFVWRPQEQ